VARPGGGVEGARELARHGKVHETAALPRGADAPVGESGEVILRECLGFDRYRPGKSSGRHGHENTQKKRSSWKLHEDGSVDEVE
jgi:hypothetical protein